MCYIGPMSAFNIIAEPNRRLLLDALLQGPRPVNDLVELVGLSQPVVSRHLRVLRDANMVTVQPVGQQRLYSLNPEALLELDRWLAPYRLMWSRRLDALGDHLDSRHPRVGADPSTEESTDSSKQGDEA